jgi:hypothetical protein
MGCTKGRNVFPLESRNPGHATFVASTIASEFALRRDPIRGLSTLLKTASDAGHLP